MYDLVALNAELDRCKVELKVLDKQIDLAAASKPVDIVEIERIARRVRELSEHVEALTDAIVQGGGNAQH